MNTMVKPHVCFLKIFEVHEYPILAKRVRDRMGAKLPLGKRQLKSINILPNGRNSLDSDADGATGSAQSWCHARWS